MTDLTRERLEELRDHLRFYDYLDYFNRDDLVALVAMAMRADELERETEELREAMGEWEAHRYE